MASWNIDLEKGRICTFIQLHTKGGYKDGSFQNMYPHLAIVEINTWCYRKPERYQYSTVQSLKSSTSAHTDY